MLEGTIGKEDKEDESASSGSLIAIVANQNIKFANYLVNKI